MACVKYDTNIKSKKNIITVLISLVVTFLHCSSKGKKRKKKPFKTFVKSFNFISELWTSFALKKKTDKIKKDTFPIKIEEAEIIHL